MVCFNTYLRGQSIIGYIPASAACWSKSFNSTSAPFFNPAALGQVENVGILLQSRQPYMLPGLSQLQCFTAIPLRPASGVFLGCKRFGNADYSELLLSVGYGMRLKKWLQFGVNIHRAISKLKGFSGHGLIIPAASLQFDTKAFNSGIFIQYQPQAPVVKSSRSVLLGMGIGKDWSSQLYTDINLSYVNGSGVVSQVSLVYQLLFSWQLVMKIQTRPLNYAFETGYSKSRLNIRICSDWHPQLGFSPGLLLGYTFKTVKLTNDEINLH